MWKLNFGGAGSWEETGKEALVKREWPGSPNPLQRQGEQHMPQCGGHQAGREGPGTESHAKVDSQQATASLPAWGEYLGYLQARLLTHILAELVHGGGDHLLRLLKDRLALAARPQQLLVIHQVDHSPSHTPLDEKPVCREGNDSSSGDTAGHPQGPRLMGGEVRTPPQGAPQFRE